MKKDKDIVPIALFIGIFSILFFLLSFYAIDSPRREEEKIQETVESIRKDPEAFLGTTVMTKYAEEYIEENFERIALRHSYYSFDIIEEQKEKSYISGWNDCCAYYGLSSDSNIATQEEIVYIAPSGSKYHYKSSCAGKNATEIEKTEAVNAGYEPCEKCVY